ncbi:hypothetical protein E5675_19015 [Sphingopyxis sp. PAMC25046]|uniref:hypothetical protein n=1 Tax=Sphingopyxis sp. PAMC25046 TaxID=2565556 RepID=UPI00109DF7EB|nr:hypothetical protein [Sphingopyxis sp. PAMC25046]QCB56314.1 hypothetical protein E5675_19015 [Sphingopyxis sp. PAMC25046]
MGKRRPVPTPEGHQQCHQCLAMKPVSAFEPCDYRPAGIKATCRPCLVADREAASYVQRMQDAAYWRERADGPSPMTAPLSALLASDIALDDHA